MAMRNRRDETNTPDWWDDLPPAIRQRITNPFRAERTIRNDEPRDTPPSTARGPHLHRPRLLRDLSQLAILFLVIAVASLLYLLIALSFLTGGPAIAR